MKNTTVEQLEANEQKLAMQEMIRTSFNELNENEQFTLFKKLVVEYEKITGDLEFKRTLE